MVPISVTDLLNQRFRMAQAKVTSTRRAKAKEARTKVAKEKVEERNIEG